MAESELGVLSTLCLDRRIPDKQTLISEAADGRTIATPITPKLTGNSQPRTPASSSKGHTLSSNELGH